MTKKEVMNKNGSTGFFTIYLYQNSCESVGLFVTERSLLLTIVVIQ